MRHRRRFVAVALACAPLAACYQQPYYAEPPPPRSLTITAQHRQSQAQQDRYGYLSLLRGYVDGTPAALKCDRCQVLPKGPEVATIVPVAPVVSIAVAASAPAVVPAPALAATVALLQPPAAAAAATDSCPPARRALGLCELPTP